MMSRKRCFSKGFVSWFSRLRSLRSRVPTLCQNPHDCCGCSMRRDDIKTYGNLMKKCMKTLGSSGVEYSAYILKCVHIKVTHYMIILWSNEALDSSGPERLQWS